MMRPLEDALSILGSDYVNDEGMVHHDTVVSVIAEALWHHGIEIDRAMWRDMIKDRVAWRRNR